MLPKFDSSMLCLKMRWSTKITKMRHNFPFSEWSHFKLFLRLHWHPPRLLFSFAQEALPRCNSEDLTIATLWCLYPLPNDIYRSAGRTETAEGSDELLVRDADPTSSSSFLRVGGYQDEDRHEQDDQWMFAMLDQSKGYYFTPLRVHGSRIGTPDVCLSVCHSKWFLRLHWYAPGLWRYQLKIGDANRAIQTM